MYYLNMNSSVPGHPSVNDSSFRGKFALVIGGSGGIGRAISIELARRGAKLLVHGRQASSRMKEMNLESHEAFDYEFRGPDDFLRALDARLEKIGAEPDIVICAFGPFLEAPLARVTAKEWEWLTLANLALPGALASRFLPGMLPRGYGRFLFFGGTRTDNIRAYTKTAAYASAKTGLGVLAKSIAAEGAPHNVAALVICPGPTDTEYLDNATKLRHAGLTATGSLLRPEVVARASLDLLDADPCIASGAIVSLDGGFMPR